MISLAVLGFLSAGILLSLFGLTFVHLIGRDTKNPIKDFGYAYTTVGVAFFVWGFAALLGDKDFLKTSVLIGNALIFLGTLLLLSIFPEVSRNIKLTGFAAITLLFFVLRLIYYPPAPTITEGILMFNTQLPIAIILGFLVIAVWLPASIRVGRILANGLEVPNFSYVFSSMYILATISIILFIAARTPNGLILSFIELLIALIVLLASNFILDRIIKKTGREILFPVGFAESKADKAVDVTAQSNIGQPSYTINNIIALIFVILLLIEWFMPRGPKGDLVDLLIYPTMIFGVVAGISFLNRVYKLTKPRSPLEKALGLLVGGFGLFLMIILGVMSGLTGALRGRPSF